MGKKLHIIAILLFVFAFLWQIIFWGGAATLPTVGPILVQSASREAPLVTSYMFVGERLGDQVPFLRDMGQQWAESAFSPGFERMKQDPDVAMALIFQDTWNATHRLTRSGVYLTLVLGIVALVLWLRRPRQVRMLGGRR
ncbi:hypothetical protein [Tahibacter amnicola]|uniref:PepSY-associated transmembrane protein n=1 Tax=Tahibacter amnicola TaxID=2976241 RepID=A0ABY6BGG8_9GAMM|nr:hypothetical protein [Tahibacter amnicola]UXI67465.1 hypothetical protein N4264_22445 [Tahibacter amnicola]